MAATCSLFYGSRLNFGGDFCYTILLTKRKFLSYIILDLKRSLKTIL